MENGLSGVNRGDGGGGMYDRRSMADAQRLDVRPAAANRQLPKTFDKREEENHYLTLAAQGDIEARNVLIERNLRLVAYIRNHWTNQRLLKIYCQQA